ncbi:hypothetical protein VULLAG_LOCUS14340 [Vulpes lagopus]
MENESEKPDFKCPVSIQIAHVGNLSEVSGGSLLTCLPDIICGQDHCPTALQLLAETRCHEKVSFTSMLSARSTKSQ